MRWRFSIREKELTGMDRMHRMKERGKRGNGKKGKRKRKSEKLLCFLFPFTPLSFYPLPPFFSS
jgi:hypothetical protein